ncbi:hypothetical protein [Afipia carboxidovorans]|uniref:hypothetical protein n=1 Tax=Afipia carboxidovorans TaxID=40137 RepID=UPI00308CA939|nr:hypothetical protein CRBSH125_09120 [Afipia carboxidovorans]
MYRTGDVVECIDDHFTPRQRVSVPHIPVNGGIYTIRQAIPGFRGLGLRLVEVVNPEITVDFGEGVERQLEPLFLASRFRLLRRREDIVSREAANAD